MIFIITLFSSLLKEYLELFCWNYYDQLVKLGLDEAKEKRDYYSEVFNCENLPNLIDDLTTRFLIADN